VILRVRAEDPRCGSVLAVAGRKSCGSLQNGLEVLKTYLVACAGEKGVLYNGILYVVLTQLLSELGVVLGIDTLVADYKTCDGILESVGKLCNDRFLLL
jgi:hypothetical protein